MALTAILGNCCLRQYALLAQSAEQLTLNQWVPGSIPGERTKPQFLLTRTGVSLIMASAALQLNENSQSEVSSIT